MQNLIKKYAGILFVLCSLFISCGESGPSENLSEVCQHDSITVNVLSYDLLGTEITLPTVFTPNGDGIDDSFYPRFEHDNLVITQYSIYTPQEWSDARIMYSTQKVVYDVPEGEPDRAWDGMSRLTEPPYDGDYEGPFRFRFFATKLYDDSLTARITCRGWACVDKSN